MKNFVDIAHILVAICAIIGILLSFKQASETSEVLSEASHVISNSALPVVIFDKYIWFNSKNNNLSCDNAPSGINVSFKNFSRLPVVVEGANLELLIGERPVEKASSRVGAGGELVLAPNQSKAQGVFTREISDVWKNLALNVEPKLKFKLSIDYRSLVNEKKFRSFSEILLLLNCKTLVRQSYSVESQSVCELVEDEDAVLTCKE